MELLEAATQQAQVKKLQEEARKQAKRAGLEAKRNAEEKAQQYERNTNQGEFGCVEMEADAEILEPAHSHLIVSGGSGAHAEPLKQRSLGSLPGRATTYETALDLHSQSSSLDHTPTEVLPASLNDLSELQHELKHLVGSGMPADLQGLETRLSAITETMVERDFTHEVDLEVCLVLLEAAAQCIQRPIVTTILTAAAAYVQGQSAKPFTLEEAFDHILHLIEACARKEVRAATANLVAVLSVHTRSNVLTELMIAHEKTILRVVVHTACTPANEIAPWVNAQTGCVQVLARLMCESSGAEDPFPHGDNARCVKRYLNNVGTTVARILLESSQLVTTLTKQIVTDSSNNVPTLRMLHQLVWTSQEVAATISSSEPAIRALLAICASKNKTEPALLAVGIFSRVAGLLVNESVLKEISDIAIRHFTHQDTSSGLCVLVSKLLQRENTENLLNFLTKPEPFEVLITTLNSSAVQTTPARVLVEVYTARDKAAAVPACIGAHGPHDGPVALALALLPKLGIDQANRLADATWQLMLAGYTTSSLSPAGQLSLVSLIYDLACMCPMFAIPNMVSTNTVAALRDIIRPAALERVECWPTDMGGGSATSVALVRQTVSALYLPFMHNSADLEKMNSSIIQTRLVSLLVSLFDVLSVESLAPPLGLLLRIILLPGKFPPISVPPPVSL